MSQHNAALKDRKVIHNDYYVDLKIWQEMREIRPMIEVIFKDLKKKNENDQSKFVGK